MKVLKKARQKNVVIDLAYYDMADIKRLMAQYQTFFSVWDEETSRSVMYYTYKDFEAHNSSMWLPDEGRELRLFLDNVSELKVVNQDGYYYCMAVTKDGEMIHITL